jgi:hypothetical protein
LEASEQPKFDETAKKYGITVKGFPTIVKVVENNGVSEVIHYNQMGRSMEELVKFATG